MHAGKNEYLCKYSGVKSLNEIVILAVFSMNQEIRDILQEIYINHKLQETNLDYSVMDRYKTDLDRLSKLSGRCFFIVDLNKFEYVFTSENFKNIFGYIPTSDSDTTVDEKLLDSKIHPDDFFEYKRTMLKVGMFILQQPKEEQADYKHIFEFRIQNLQKQYIRVSWERQALETDKLGNLWLMLGAIHVLSNQNDVIGIKSFFINQRTGEHIPFDFPSESHFELTPREKEILGLIQQGLLSKEIAERLFISVNTVNIHRQNILQKMQVSNSIEAVDIGRKAGILK